MTDDEWSKIVELIKSNQVILAMQIGVGFGMSKVETIRKYWLHQQGGLGIYESKDVPIGNYRVYNFSSICQIGVYNSTSVGPIVQITYTKLSTIDEMDIIFIELIKLIENESKD